MMVPMPTDHENVHANQKAGSQQAGYRSMMSWAGEYQSGLGTRLGGQRAYWSEECCGPFWDFCVLERLEPDREPSCLVLFSDVAFKIQCLRNEKDSVHT